METSVMIRQLRYTAKKHEKDTLHTFDTNIRAMCTDVANRLEELEKEKVEIRAKAIEEFAEALKKELNEYDFWKYDIITDLEIMETNVSRDYIVDEIASELKGE